MKTRWTTLSLSSASSTTTGSAFADESAPSTRSDLNAIFYGVYDAEAQERQRRGEAVPIPEIQ